MIINQVRYKEVQKMEQDLKDLLEESEKNYVEVIFFMKQNIIKNENMMDQKYFQKTTKYSNKLKDNKPVKFTK